MLCQNFESFEQKFDHRMAQKRAKTAKSELIIKINKYINYFFILNLTYSALAWDVYLCEKLKNYI